MTFVYYLTLGYAAATLLTSGIGHGLGFVSFRDIVRSHDIIPADFAAPAAALVTALELVAGVASLVVLWSEEAAAWASLLFAVCAVAGGAFALYVCRLLSRPDGITSCGCSAFVSPLTLFCWRRFWVWVLPDVDSGGR
jgi:uncharacterized membrane protein